MSLARYPEYKVSGVGWLGDVPEHWGLKRIKYVIRKLDQGWSPQCENFPAADGEWAVLKVGCVNGGVFNPDENKALPPDLLAIPELSIRAGDVLISRANTRELVGSAAVARNNFPRHLLCDKLYRLETNSNLCLPEYLASYLCTPPARAEIELAATGASSSMVNIGQATVTGMLMAIPDPSEQSLIMTFLSRENSKIDALVEEQRRLIELLKEKRQAVISHAVTKGLNPAASMKDSGVEWLGKVPEHWNITPIGHFCSRISYGFTNPMPTTDDGPYMLTANDVDYGEVKYETARRTSLDAYLNELTDKSRPRRGDILITKDGTLGRVAVHDGRDACINQSVAALRVNPNVMCSHFLAVGLLGSLYQSRMLFDAGGTTIKHIYISRLAKMPLAYPPISEQQAILTLLADSLAKLNTLIAEGNRAIDLLQERRTALISAAVTGKIDVRGLVAEESVA